jgi:hypothetical protein
LSVASLPVAGGLGVSVCVTNIEPLFVCENVFM